MDAMLLSKIKVRLFETSQALFQDSELEKFCKEAKINPGDTENLAKTKLVCHFRMVVIKKCDELRNALDDEGRRELDQELETIFKNSDKTLQESKLIPIYLNHMRSKV